MERLTRKEKIGYCPNVIKEKECDDLFVGVRVGQIVDKLGKLEDLMEKHNRPTIDSLDNIICAGEILNDLNKEVKASCMIDFINYIKDRVKIEKELGIDLITLVKIFSGYGIFGYTIDKDHKKRYIYYFPKRDIVLNTDDKTLDIYWQGEDKLYRKYKLTDYGKKKVGGWALTEEELL